MNIIYDSIYHHVPSTPCFQPHLTQDAAVPQSSSYCCRKSGFSLDLMVPSTPVIICRTRNVYSTPQRDPWCVNSFTTKNSTTLSGKETPKLSSLEPFKRFSEQVVPSTPLLQGYSSKSSTRQSPGNVGTPHSRPTIKRRELARARLSTSPLVHPKLTTAHENTGTQLNLFSGDDIFA